MENERVNAFTMYYERAELDGKTLFGTGASIDHATVPAGYYCYDMYGDGLGTTAEHYFISQTALKQKAEGAVLTERPLTFNAEGKLGLGNLQVFEDEPMVSLEQLLAQKMDSQEPSEAPVMVMTQM